MLAYPVHALDDHLAETLAGPHDIGGVDRLVRADQHKPLGSVFHRRESRLVGSDHIVFDGLVGTCLHQRHMLVGRRVIDDLRPICIKYHLHPAAVPDRADQRYQVQIGVFLLQFLLDIVGVVLVNIKDNQLLGMMSGNLSAELTSDRAAPSGNQNSLSLNIGEDLVHIDLDGIPSQQILHRHFLHPAKSYFPVYHLIDAGQYLQLTAGLLADI